jgi:hypothetical protein
MNQTIRDALDKVTKAADEYDEALQNAAQMAADAATQSEHARLANEEADQARQFEAGCLTSFRDAVDELDAILTPPATSGYRSPPRRR